MLNYRILYSLLLWSLACHAQTNPASQKALNLRSNVVHIKAAQDVGFGFITGEENGKLYVATAAHVLMNNGILVPSVEVQFYQIKEPFMGKVVFVDQAMDITLVEVPKPTGLNWQTNVRAKPAIGEYAAFVGRDGDWYVPLLNSVGNINQVADQHIYVDINSVVPGTSGAPLVTPSGIVGMILDHSGYNAEVLSLAKIKGVLKREVWPFQLTFEQFGLVGDTWYDEDGKEYPTKVMDDGKRWLIKNLDLQVENSWCYDDDPANCAKYGRLYTWEAAQEACIEIGAGWRLPKDEEWSNLRGAFGNAKKAYKALIEGGSSGFAAQLGGWRSRYGYFGFAGSLGYYWSSSPNGSSNAWRYFFSRNSGQLYRVLNSRDYGRSVRCLQDL